MENVEIAAALSEIADLLEIQGGNPFKVRAYRNAVRTIGNLTRSLAEMVNGGEDLTALAGIGRDIAGYITELVRTGHTRRLDELEKQTPGTLAELMRLDGVGPKRARQLHDELGIDSIDDLARALEEGRVGGLRGFGDKTVARLRRSLADFRKHGDRFELHAAERFVQPLLEHMRRAPGVEHVEAAGSFRRRVETVGDIDLLALADEAAPVMGHFADYPAFARVEASGPTRAAAVLRSGLRVDLRVVPGESYGAALHYFTGSKAHNVAVRRIGVERGLRINEYGVFDVRGRRRKRIGGAREQDVFEAVGLEWVPPELREDRGEIDAAREGKLPRLIERKQIHGDLQMHSTWTDGLATIEEMARGCAALGYDYMALTDHSRAVTVARGLTPQRLKQQWKEIERVRSRLPDLLILRGLEVDILGNGDLDLSDELIAGLDVVLVSVHSRMNMPRSKMTDRVIRGISHPGVHILAHPTGRIINRRLPYEIDIEAVLRAAADLGIAVEINAQPHRLDLDDVHARRARELGIPIAINTDAHAVENLGFMACGIDQARRAWLEKADVLNAWPRARLQRWLARRRPTPDTL